MNVVSINGSNVQTSGKNGMRHFLTLILLIVFFASLSYVLNYLNEQSVVEDKLNESIGEIIRLDELTASEVQISSGSQIDNAQVATIVDIPNPEITQKEEITDKPAIKQQDEMHAYKVWYQIYHQEGHYTALERVFTEGLNQNPNNSYLAQTLVKVYLEQNKKTATLKLLNGLNVAAISDPELLGFMGMIYQQLMKYKKAESLYRSALKLDSTESKWWMGLGLALESQGKWEMAKEAYSKAIAEGNVMDTLRTFVDQKINTLHSTM